MFLRFIIIVSLVFLIASCDTVMTQKQIASKYENTSIANFIRDRYAIRNHPFVSKLDHVFSTLHKVVGNTKPPSIDDYTYKILGDKRSVLFPLSFNKSNYRFLYKPSREAQEFCSTNNGVLFINKRYNIDFQGLKESPFIEAARAYHDNNHELTVSYSDLSFDSIFPKNVHTVTIDKKVNSELSAESAFVNSVNVNRSSISEIYKNAIQRNAFGIYSCRSNKAGHKILWKISLKPVMYKVSSKYDHDLYILIRPIPFPHKH